MPADAQQLSAKAKIRLWRRILTDEKSGLEYSDLALPHVIRGESRRVAEEREAAEMFLLYKYM